MPLKGGVAPRRARGRRAIGRPPRGAAQRGLRGGPAGCAWRRLATCPRASPSRRSTLQRSRHPRRATRSLRRAPRRQVGAARSCGRGGSDTLPSACCSGDGSARDHHCRRWPISRLLLPLGWNWLTFSAALLQLRRRSQCRLAPRMAIWASNTKRMYMQLKCHMTSVPQPLDFALGRAQVRLLKAVVVWRFRWR